MQSADVTVEIPVENGRKVDANVIVAAEILERDGKSVAALNQTAAIAAGA